ncbi:MAG: SPASM domain-containing protein [Actinomycetes bacterium]
MPGDSAPTSGVPVGIGGRTDTGACAAPAVQMFLRPDGDVRVCCLNERALGNIRDTRLLDLWNSDRRRAITDALRAHDFSMGCTTCGHEVASEGRPGSYPASFDEWLPDGLNAPTPEWPAVLDINLSISCNLQCIQCNGEQSSAIRIHRERRPALAVPYDDQFFDDLGEFLPHARLARFAGGEPFLGPEFFRVWELIADRAPDLECVVITNATQWNDRVRDTLRRVRMGFVLSIDAATESTYESIRVGASFAEMRRNVQHFRDHARAAGTHCSINFCLMQQNVREFPDLLLWAEDLGLHVDVSVVRDPPRCSIPYIPQTQIRDHYEALAARDAAMRQSLRVNGATWATELERLRTWATCPPEELASLRGISEHMVLLFKCEGVGAHDDRAAVDALREFAPGGPIARLRVNRWQHIVEVTPEFEQMFRVAPAELIDQPVQLLNELVQQRCGEYQDYRVVAESPDRADITYLVDGHPTMAILVAQRGPDGWAEHADILFAMR